MLHFALTPNIFILVYGQATYPQWYQKLSGSDKNPKSACPLIRGTSLSFHFFWHGFLLTHFPFSLLLLCEFGSSFLWDFSCLQSPIFLPFSASCLLRNLPFFLPVFLHVLPLVTGAELFSQWQRCFCLPLLSGNLAKLIPAVTATLQLFIVLQHNRVSMQDLVSSWCRLQILVFFHDVKIWVASHFICLKRAKCTAIALKDMSAFLQVNCVTFCELSQTKIHKPKDNLSSVKKNTLKKAEGHFTGWNLYVYIDFEVLSFLRC